MLGYWTAHSDLDYEDPNREPPVECDDDPDAVFDDFPAQLAAMEREAAGDAAGDAAAPSICGYCGAAVRMMEHTAFCIYHPRFAEASHGDASAPSGAACPAHDAPDAPVQKGGQEWRRRSRVAAISYRQPGTAGEALRASDPAAAERRHHLERAYCHLFHADDSSTERGALVGEAIEHLEAVGLHELVARLEEPWAPDVSGVKDAVHAMLRETP